jgi:hypothetical protein
MKFLYASNGKSFAFSNRKFHSDLKRVRSRARVAQLHTVAKFRKNKENKFIVFIFNNRITETLRSGLRERELKKTRGDGRKKRQQNLERELRDTKGGSRRWRIPNNNHH